METLELMLKTLREKGAYYIDPENKEIYTREHLGETLAGNYGASLLAIEDESLLNTLRIIDDDAFMFLNDLINAKTDPSLSIFYLQYFLNNKLPFVYKELVFKDIKSIGQSLFDDKLSEKISKEILDNKLMTYYLRVIGVDSIDEHLYKSVELAENAVEFSDAIRYHLMAYALCQKDNYQYASHKFYSIEDFYRFLSKKRKMIRFSKTFNKDANFMAWLLYNGKYEICLEWQKKVAEYSEADAKYSKK